jgi:hypothetical protein
MIKSIILPTALLPNIEYISLIYKAELVLIEAYETFPRQTYRNRYEIAGPNGLQKLIVPVAKSVCNNCEVNKVIISYDENWPLIHWRSIVTAYNSSPYFLYYKDEFEDIFFKNHLNLLELNQQFLNLILKVIGIKTTVSFTNSYVRASDINTDFRNVLHPRNNKSNDSYSSYYQVFSQKYGFLPNISIIDLIFNLGPESIEIIKKIR